MWWLYCQNIYLVPKLEYENFFLRKQSSRIDLGVLKINFICNIQMEPLRDDFINFAPPASGNQTFSLLATYKFPKPVFTMKKRFLPYVLVTIQLSSLLFLLGSAPMLAYSPEGMLVEVTGLFLGILAIFTMRIGNFRITPLIKSGGQLVTSGIYSYIRHPMYLAQVVLVAPLVVDYFSWIRLGVIVLLCVDLLVKIRFEEKLLVAHFDGYAAYQKKTWKVLPFVY